MEKLKILDMDYGCGGFTKGLEDTGLFEVVCNGSLNKKNLLCYNKTHINNFEYPVKEVKKDVDLVVITPHLRKQIGKISPGNIQKTYLDNATAFVTINDFDNIIFLTPREAIPLLQNSQKVLRYNDGTPTKDIISCRLIELGYNVYNFILDGAGFGLAQHKYYNVYWASKIDENILIKEGFGFYKRSYRKVKHFLRDISDESILSWHQPNYSNKEFCSYIIPGSSAKKCDDIPIKTGYIRLDGENLSAPLLNDFYIASSKSPSIHPWYDRPLTIREGARLFGLTDDFTWDSKLTKREVSMMIYESFPPAISQLMGRKIAKIIKKNE